MARSRRTSRLLILPMCPELFNRRSPHPGGSSPSFPGAENKEPLHLAVFLGDSYVAKFLLSGFGGRKGTSRRATISIL